MSLRAHLAQGQLALMLLTRLPAGSLPAPVPDLAQARWAFALVGLPVGALCWAVLWAALQAGMAPAVAALLALGAGAGVTGALHHDGLADFADGIGGGRDRDHCLEIMRDSRIGSYGVLALILAVGVQAGALAALSGQVAAVLPMFLLIAVASRLAMVAVLAALPPARAEGLGHMAGGRRAGALVPGLVLVVALAVWLGGAALPVLAAMAGAAALVAWRAHVRIGGQTGDVLGAAQMCSATAGWAVASALPG